MNTTTQTILDNSLQTGIKLSEYGFIDAGGKRFNYRDYVVAFNKQFKAMNQAKLGNLISLLKSETESLRVQYIEMTKEYAVNEFGRIEIEASKPYPRFEDFATPGFVKGSGFSGIDYKQGMAYRKASDRHQLCLSIVREGIEKHVSKAVILAERHYEDSILKLALRIEKKNMNQEAITVKTSHIGVNIETILTDGIQTVRAWTIIASGPIQKPHYRYLVK